MFSDLSKEDLIEEIGRLNKIIVKQEKEIDNSKHCQYCANYSWCKSEICKKCCHKSNFKRITVADIKNK